MIEDVLCVFKKIKYFLIVTVDKSGLEGSFWNVNRKEEEKSRNVQVDWWFNLT